MYLILRTISQFLQHEEELHGWKCGLTLFQYSLFWGQTYPRNTLLGVGSQTAK